MNVIEIARPKNIDLEELFNIKGWVAPTFKETEVMPRQLFEVGQEKAMWISTATKVVGVDGLVVIWNDQSKENIMLPGSVFLGKSDTLIIHFHWH